MRNTMIHRRFLSACRRTAAVIAAAAVLAGSMPAGSYAAELIEDSAEIAELPEESLVLDTALSAEDLISDDAFSSDAFNFDDEQTDNTAFVIHENDGIEVAEESEETAERPAEWEEELLTEAVEEAADLYMLSEEETEDPLIEDTELPEMMEIEEDTMELSSPEAVPDSNQSGPVLMMRRLMRSAGSSADSSFTYGKQLTGNAVLFYNFLVEQYVVNGSTELEPVCMISSDLGFDMTDYTADVTPTVDETTGKKSFDRESGTYPVIRLKILADVQSAWDAFCYDYPELFWYHAGSISSIISPNADYTQVTYSGVRIKAIDKFDNARSFIPAFESGVSTVVENLRASSDFNGDGRVSDMELMQAAHDYIINRMSYDHARLAAYNAASNSGQKITDYTIFNAAGAFVNDPAIGTSFVCEGYSKAFKILMNRLGITCVLIPGRASQNNASSIGHMWNAVIIDDSWYLIDCTWDDTSSGPKYTYFLFVYGTNNEGTVDPNGADVSGTINQRTAYTRFSGVQNNAQTFTTPTTDGSTAHNFALTRQERAVCTGYQEYACTDGDGAAYFVSTGTGAAGHTLSADGTCTVCGFYNLNRTEPLQIASDPASAASWVLVDSTDGRRIDEQYILYPLYNSDGSLSAFLAEGTGISFGSSITFDPYDISRLSVSLSADTVTYTGKAAMPKVTLGNTYVTLAEGTQFTVTADAAVTNVGTHTLTVTGAAPYKGSITKSYTVKKASISSIKLSSASLTYTGKARTQKITVKSGSKTLTAGKDYKVTYTNNKNIGQAQVTVKGTGNYTGTKKASFRIVPKNITVGKAAASGSGKVTVTWKKASGVSGYQIRYSMKKNFASAKKVTISKSSATKTQLTKLTRKKTWYISIRSYKTVKGVKYYSAWSAAAKVKVN